MKRRKTSGITKASRAAVKEREHFRATRAAVLVAVRRSLRAVNSARVRIEKVLETLPEKVELADSGMAKLEQSTDVAILGASQTPLADGVENATRAMGEAFDELASEFETLLQTIKDAKRGTL